MEAQRCQLRGIGMNVSNEWLDIIFTRHQRPTINQLIQCFINSDICRSVSGGILPELNDSDYVLSGPCVLQIEQLANIGAKTESRLTNTTACFKMLLTDGEQQLVGLEVERIPSISWDTRIGSKVLIVNAPIRRGVVLLAPTNCKFLGGKGIERTEDALLSDADLMAVSFERPIDIDTHPEPDTMHHHEEPISVYSSSIDDIEDLVGPALARAVNTPTTDDCLRLPKHAPSSVPSDIIHPSESSTVHSLASASFVSFDSGWPHIAVGKTSMSFTTTDYTCVVESKAEVQDLTSPSQDDDLLPPPPHLVNKPSHASAETKTKKPQAGCNNSDDSTTATKLKAFRVPTRKLSVSPESETHTNNAPAVTWETLMMLARNQPGEKVRRKVAGKFVNIRGFNVDTQEFHVSCTFESTLPKLYRCKLSTSMAEKFINTTPEECYVEMQSITDRHERTLRKKEICHRFNSLKGECECVIEATCFEGLDGQLKDADCEDGMLAVMTECTSKPKAAVRTSVGPFQSQH